MEAPPRPILAARVDPPLYETFALAAQSQGITISAALRLAARDYIEATATQAPRARKAARA